MLLNVKKTKFITSEECTGLILGCQGEAIEKVEEFRYFRSDLSKKGRRYHAVRRRINTVWLKKRESTEILCHCWCSRTLKGKPYEILVRPVLYGSEFCSWVRRRSGYCTPRK